MGEKEIRPAGGAVVVPPPRPEVPKTVEKEGSGGPKDDQDPNKPQSKADFDKQAADSAAAAAKSGVHDTLYKDGWYEGKDASGKIYAQDPDGVRAQWDAKAKQFMDPNTGKPMPKDWGAKHKPK